MKLHFYIKVIHKPLVAENLAYIVACSVPLKNDEKKTVAV